jgi:hypothetical protein
MLESFPKLYFLLLFGIVSDGCKIGMLCLFRYARIQFIHTIRVLAFTTAYCIITVDY